MVTKLRSSDRAVFTVNQWAISLALVYFAPPVGPEPRDIPADSLEDQQTPWKDLVKEYRNEWMCIWLQIETH